MITPMKVGITYDLRDDYLAEGLDDLETAEFDRIETIDAIDEALRALGHATDRIGRARQLVDRLAQGERWGLVFNICEGLHGVGREAQVPTLLDLYDIDYTFADPGAMIACLHKGFAKTLVARAGLPTADFAIIETLADLEAGTPLQGFPLFVKPIAEGTGKGVSPASIVHDPRELVATCTALLSAHRQPVLVERYLPGHEFTVGVLGTGRSARPLGTMEIILGDAAEAGAYTYQNKEHWEERVSYRHYCSTSGDASDATVQQVETLAVRAWRVLGGRDGGRVDVRCDGRGQPHLLEVNPLAGLHPTHSDLPMIANAAGMPYRDLIEAIVSSAMERTRRSEGAVPALTF